MFSWGGCGGVVPFVTERDCLAAECLEQSCVKEPDSGPCEAAIPKWFYNKTSGVRPSTSLPVITNNPPSTSLNHRRVTDQ